MTKNEARAQFWEWLRDSPRPLSLNAKSDTLAREGWDLFLWELLRVGELTRDEFNELSRE